MAENALEKIKEEKIERQLGHLLLELQRIYNMTSKCISKLVAELQILSFLV